MSLSFLAGSLLTALPDAETIRRKASEVVARPEFQLDTDRDRESLSIWVRIFIWIIERIRWFFELLEGLPSPLWWLVVIALSVITILLIVHIVWSLIYAIKGTSRRPMHSLAGDSRAKPEDLERKATQAEKDGDLIGAIRLWFRAGILRIELSEQKSIRRGLTNHELLRRYRTSPLFEPLQWFVQTIDSKWYGYSECVPDDCLACRAEYSRICQLVDRRTHAVGT